MSSASAPSVRPLAAPPAALADAETSPRDGAGEAARRRDAHLVVRVGDERFAIPIGSVAEGVESPTVIAVPGAGGRWLGLVEWRGRRIPLGGAGAPLGREAATPCAAAIILDDAAQPLALAVDELCDARVLQPSAMRPFSGRHDPHGVVRGVAWDEHGLVAVVSTPAVRAAMLAAATPLLPSRPAAPVAITGDPA